MNRNTINSFRKENHFLSNMFDCKVTFDGITYKSAESAFQAQKSLDADYRLRLSRIDGYAAKREGKKVELRPDWDEVKLDVMYKIIFAKFTQNRDLRNKLIATGDSILEEGNTWGDTFWGMCNGVGDNHLGKILMKVRAELMIETVNVDDCFVPDSTTNGLPAHTTQGKLREQESGYSNYKATEAKLDLDEILSGIVISNTFAAEPEDGIHKVVLNTYPEANAGKGGNEAYMTMELRDEDGRCWKAFVSLSEIHKTLEDISFYNEGMLSIRDGKQAINHLLNNTFYCWTAKLDSGKIKTYFNPEKADKYFYYKAMREGKRELREAEYNRRKEAGEDLSIANIRSSGTKRPTENEAINDRTPF